MNLVFQNEVQKKDEKMQNMEKQIQLLSEYESMVA